MCVLTHTGMEITGMGLDFRSDSLIEPWANCLADLLSSPCSLIFKIKRLDEIRGLLTDASSSQAKNINIM